jgi:hypothetical protein
MTAAASSVQMSTGQWENRALMVKAAVTGHAPCVDGLIFQGFPGFARTGNFYPGMTLDAGHLSMDAVKGETGFLMVKWADRFKRVEAVAFLAVTAQLAVMIIPVTGNTILVNGFVTYGLANTGGEPVLFFQMAFLANHAAVFSFQRIG